MATAEEYRTAIRLTNELDDRLMGYNSDIIKLYVTGITGPIDDLCDEAVSALRDLMPRVGAGVESYRDELTRRAEALEQYAIDYANWQSRHGSWYVRRIDYLHNDGEWPGHEPVQPRRPNY